MDSARLVHTFWALSSSLEIDVWFEFVYSEANIADWPSRGELGFVAELRALSCDMEVPATDSWGNVSIVLGLSDSVPEPPRKKSRRR